MLQAIDESRASTRDRRRDRRDAPQHQALFSLGNTSNFAQSRSLGIRGFLSLDKLMLEVVGWYLVRADLTFNRNVFLRSDWASQKEGDHAAIGNAGVLIAHKQGHWRPFAISKHQIVGEPHSRTESTALRLTRGGPFEPVDGDEGIVRRTSAAASKNKKQLKNRGRSMPNPIQGSLQPIARVASLSAALVLSIISPAAALQPISLHQQNQDIVEVRAGARGGRVAMGPRGGAVVHRGGAVVGPRGAAYRGRTAVVGPRGNVAVRSTTAVARRGGWARPSWYRWPAGGAIAAGAAIGMVTAATAAAWAGAPPAAGMCWYYTDPSRTQGFWDYCQ